MKIQIWEREYDLTKIKTFAKSHPDYPATHYICHVPKQESDTSSPFHSSWVAGRQASGQDTRYHDAYWSIFDPGQKGYELADEKYLLRND